MNKKGLKGLYKAGPRRAVGYCSCGKSSRIDVAVLISAVHIRNLDGREGAQNERIDDRMDELDLEPGCRCSVISAGGTIAKRCKWPAGSRPRVPTNTAASPRRFGSRTVWKGIVLRDRNLLDDSGTDIDIRFFAAICIT